MTPTLRALAQRHNLRVVLLARMKLDLWLTDHGVEALVLESKAKGLEIDDRFLKGSHQPGSSWGRTEIIKVRPNYFERTQKQYNG